MYKNKTGLFIYSLVFLSEFSFFFALPILAQQSSFSASQVGFAFSLAIVIESVVMISMAGFLHSKSRSNVLSISLILRSIAYLFLVAIDTIMSWYLFFAILAISKSLSKPILREVLINTVAEKDIKISMNYYSFFQNFAIVIAPIVAVVSIQVSIEKYFFFSISFINFVCVYFSYKLVYSTASKNNNDVKQYNNPFKYIGLLSKDKTILLLMVSIFFTVFLMQIFITVTTLLPRTRSDFSEYVSLFFTIVGVTICVWQGIIAKHIKFNDNTMLLLLTILGGILSLLFMGNLFVAILALIAYSIFESILVPHIYYNASIVKAIIPQNVLFSFILVSGNIGGALGAYLTGIIIDFAEWNITLVLTIMIAISVILSILPIYRIKKGENI